MAAAVASSPANSLRLKPLSTTVRFISGYRKTYPIILSSVPKTLATNSPFSSKPHIRHYIHPLFPGVPIRRLFSNVIASALSSGEAIERQKTEVLEAQKVGKFRKRLRIADIKEGPDEGLDRLGQNLVVKGWVRTLRLQSSVTLIEVNVGSCLSNMQCVVNSDAEGYDQVESGLTTTGAWVCIEEVLVTSQGSKQKAELKVKKLMTVARVRNALAYATHKFFQENGFVWISSPIITASDCEGAGKQFCVTTLIPSSREATDSPAGAIPRTEDGLIDWSQDFFGRPAFLTVSGQLNAETYATALSDVYTFGPTFRAENSNTSRHLAEFWMMTWPVQLPFSSKVCSRKLQGRLDFFNTWIEKGIISRLSDVVEKNFTQLTYTDAVELLLRAKKKFEFPVKWGCDLQSEHERYITEEAFSGCPVIVRDYPKEIKAFYMRQNDDGKTVAAMDLLVPRIGELIGGSQREERLDYLEDRFDDLKLNKEIYWWYLDLRLYGSVPHAGFGLGFERLVQFATGVENIRDAIPFPRLVQFAEF